jgi:hypothetical protein
MRLPSRREVGLDADVELLLPERERAAAGAAERLRLLELARPTTSR